MALRISNEILTHQLREVLLAGTGITLVPTTNKTTTIESSGGGGFVPTLPITNLNLILADPQGALYNADPSTLVTSTEQDLLYCSTTANSIQLNLQRYLPRYSSALSYAPGALFVHENLVYSTSADGSFVNPYTPPPLLSVVLNDALYQRHDVLNNITQLALKSRHDYSALCLRPNGTAPAYIGNMFGLLNGQPVPGLQFPAAAELRMDPLSYDDLALNEASDATVVLAGRLGGSGAGAYVSFSGNANVFPLILRASAKSDAFELSCGELHTFPAVESERHVIAIRIAYANSFVPQLTVFVDGQRVYHKFVEATDKSLGLAGRVSLGDALGNVNMDLAAFACYNVALSDDECAALATELAFSKHLQLAPLSLAPSVEYRSSEGTAASYPPHANGDPDLVLAMAVGPNNPVFQTSSNTIALPTYNYRFANGSGPLVSDALGAGYLTGPFTLALAYVPKSPAGSCDVFSVTMGPDVVTVRTQLSITRLEIALHNTQTNATTAQTIALDGATNNEMLLFLAYSFQSGFSLVAIRIDGADYASCTSSYDSANSAVVDFVSLGSQQNTANSIFYAGDFCFFPRLLTLDEMAAHAAQLAQTYGLPLAFGI